MRKKQTNKNKSYSAVTGPICGYDREESTKQTTVVSYLDQWESARKILSLSFNSHKYNIPDCVSMSVKKITCLKLIKRDSSKETASLSIWHVWSSRVTCNCIICCGIAQFSFTFISGLICFLSTTTRPQTLGAKSCLSSEHDFPALTTGLSLPSRALRWKWNSLMCS